MSSAAFVGGHVAVVVFHVAIAVALLMCAAKLEEHPKIQKCLWWCGGLLLLASLLAIVPVAMNDKYEVN